MRKLAKFLGLTGSQRLIFLQALVMLPLVTAGVRMAGLRRIQALLAHASPRARGDAEEIARLVMAAARNGPCRASCLARSLALQWFLRRRGIDTQLRLGVRKQAGRLEAHAWLERQGLPLVERREDFAGFAAFDQAVTPRAGASR